MAGQALEGLEVCSRKRSASGGEQASAAQDLSVTGRVREVLEQAVIALPERMRRIVQAVYGDIRPLWRDSHGERKRPMMIGESQMIWFGACQMRPASMMAAMMT